jgi:hypothetical protein
MSKIKQLKPEDDRSEKNCSEPLIPSAYLKPFIFEYTENKYFRLFFS